MLGKQKCKILREIRQKIADENDIPYVTKECTHKGECRGTCPKCESELRYLEQQLAARQALGKKVAVAALCAGLAFGVSACGPDREPAPRVSPSPTAEPDVLEGEVAYYPEDDLAGFIAPEETPAPEDEWELEGDVAYDPSAENGNG